ncbi:hypothetical protein C8F01DRAFT_1138449 [Mycena amicta]|nr:hypothetical protein C8F01DRAFT_1138449 [Mycena amicta]
MSLTPNDRVPPELWIETFKDADLSFDDLQALCLTNRSFVHLARPLLFSHFRFRAYVSEPDANIPGELVLQLPNARLVQRNLERLEFWLSDTIAPLVRTCEIESWGRRGLSSLDGPFTPLDHPDGMLGPLVAQLERFSGLQHLILWGLRIGGDLLLKVSRMLSINELKVARCTVKAAVPSSSPRITDGPRISRVVFHGRDYVPRDMDMDMGPWTPFLDPRYLRTLSMAGFRSWSDAPQAVPIFPRITQLSITISYNWRPQYQSFKEILPKFPAVEVLEITSRSHPTESGILQHLSAGSQAMVASLKELVLFAPIAFVPIFLSPTTSLTHLTLDHWSISASRLLASLPETPLPSVHSLAFAVLDSETPTVSPMDILARFPNVRELRVDLQRQLTGSELGRHFDNPFALTLFASIATSGVLSQEIASIALRHFFYAGNGFRAEIPPQRPVKLDEIALLRDKFTGYTKLASLILHGGAFYVKWSRDAGGYVAEYMTDDADEATMIWNGEYQSGFHDGYAEI